jgi:hypothetical protein
MQCREYLYCDYTVYIFVGKGIFLFLFIVNVILFTHTVF